MKTKNIVTLCACGVLALGAIAYTAFDNKFFATEAAATTYTITLSFDKHISVASNTPKTYKSYTAKTKNGNSIKFTVGYDTFGDMCKIYNNTALKNIKSFTFKPLSRRVNTYILTANTSNPERYAEGVHTVNEYTCEADQSYTINVPSSYSDKYFSLYVSECYQPFISSLKITYYC